MPTSTAKYRRFGLSTLRSRQGSSIAEALVGTAIATTGLTALCVASADCLSITRAHREVMVANQCLQQRAEQYRAANWQQLTKVDGVRALLSQPPVNDKVLAGQTETITVNAYPPVQPSVDPIKVTRNADGGVIVESQPSGYSLRDALAVRIDFREGWTSVQANRARSREASIVIALEGRLH